MSSSTSGLLGVPAIANLARSAHAGLFVSEAEIPEADIAREMQHHRTPTPGQSRAAAARALVVRELLRREIERLGLAAEAHPIGRETAEEACIRELIECEVADRLPDRIRVRHILLAASSNDFNGRLNARREAERLIGELAANVVPFAEFAMRYSRCPSRNQGGYLGWLQRGQTTPEFDRQVFRLVRGLAAFPIESRWGYHVVSIDDIKPGEALGFEAVREQICDYLELQARQCELQRYLRGLQQRYGVSGLEEIDAHAT
jgi:peptidyl-prolyl cis-trans isomerase C